MGSGDSYEMGMPVKELLNTFGRLDGFKQKIHLFSYGSQLSSPGPQGIQL